MTHEERWNRLLPQAMEFPRRRRRLAFELPVVILAGLVAATILAWCLS